MEQDLEYIHSLIDKKEDWSILPTKPLVSVLVATYNHEDYIKECIDGILMQMLSLSDIALIIPHLELAVNVLPDGTNAHCTIKTPVEWQEVLSGHWKFVVRLYHHSSKHAFFLCSKNELEFKLLILLSAQIAGSEFQKNITSSLICRINNLI
jgi:cellulose synthase/poly-beta-1,6-N-acetylglucosamine synthase-like glycosyltransferase